MLYVRFIAVALALLVNSLVPFSSVSVSPVMAASPIEQPLTPEFYDDWGLAYPTISKVLEIVYIDCGFGVTLDAYRSLGVAQSRVDTITREMELLGGDYQQVYDQYAAMLQANAKKYSGIPEIIPAGLPSYSEMVDQICHRDLSTPHSVTTFESGLHHYQDVCGDTTSDARKADQEIYEAYRGYLTNDLQQETDTPVFVPRKLPSSEAMDHLLCNSSSV